MRLDVRIGELGLDRQGVAPAELAAAVERELSRLLAGRPAKGAGPGAEVARAVHTALRERGLEGRLR